ncbi:MAG: hypothetical protein EXR55_00940 [Dehalococcoidia bacterium]|nr:hypothetical protein [Dehalococcoidia bacterium]
MVRHAYLLVFVLLAVTLGCGGPEPASTLWTRQFGSSITDSANGVGVDGAGNVYVVGNSFTDGPLLPDAFVRKYGPKGTELWTSQFDSPHANSAQGGALDEAGNVYVVGYTNGALPGQTPLGSTDAFVRKYTPDGEEVWTN